MREGLRILRMFENESNKDTFPVIIRAKVALIGHFGNWSAKMSEEQFKQDRFDRLPEILAIIREEEARVRPELLSALVPLAV